MDFTNVNCSRTGCKSHVPTVEVNCWVSLSVVLCLARPGAMIGGLSGSSTISENFHKVVLRLVVDHFDRPVHETVLVDSEKALAKDNKLYKEAMEKAELWYGRVIGLMHQASEQTRELPSNN